jgi:sRNA-binding regulator protein Hfq
MSKTVARASALASPAVAKFAVLEPPAAAASAAITAQSAVLAKTGSAKATASGSAPTLAATLAPARKRRAAPSAAPQTHFTAQMSDEDAANRQAELFYLQKQIQLQTQMVFILEDGERVQGIIEWYDRHSIKVRGKSRVLIFKSAIKYLYKAGEIGTAPQK